MSFFKNVWADLVERKLWPVAVGLLVALVALPVALGRSGGEASVESSAAPATPAAAQPATQVVSLTTNKAKGAPLGSPHDPFHGLGKVVAAAATGQSPSVSPAPSPSAVVGGVPSDGGAVPTAPSAPPPSDDDITTPVPPSSPSTPVAPATIAAGYRVDVTYGRTGSTRSMTDLARLSPFNAINAPIALFVGTKDDQNTAIFMILADVAASGDGTCRPSPSDCQVVGLHPGDAELFDVPTSDGRVLRYELQVDKISRKLVRSARAGITSRHRESDAGRKLLHDAIASRSDLYVAKYRYALGKGVVTKVMPRAARAASAGAVTAP
jgi:hypothetical protein